MEENFRSLGSIFNKTGLRKRCKNLFYSILHCLVLIAIGWEHPPCSNLIHSTWPLVTSINFSNAWRLVSISLYWALIAAAHSDAKWSNSSNEFSESSLEHLSSAPAFTPRCFPCISHVPKIGKKKIEKMKNLWITTETLSWISSLFFDKNSTVNISVMRMIMMLFT